MSTRLREIEDAAYARAVAAVRKHGRASVVIIQAETTASYNGALEFIERMVKEGILGELTEDGTREVLPPP